MEINGIDGMTYAELDAGIAAGGKFVYYQYAISILVMTFKRSSDIYYIPATDSRLTKGLPFLFLTLLVGWWGIPWGPIYTVQSIAKNLGGGKDVTDQVLANLRGATQAPIPASRIADAPAQGVAPGAA